MCEKSPEHIVQVCKHRAVSMVSI